MMESVTQSERKIQLSSTRAARERLKSRVKRCLDLGKNLKNDPTKVDQFKARCSRMSECLFEYSNLTEKCYSLALNIDPTSATEEFAEDTIHFEELYYAMMEIYDSFNKQPQVATQPLVNLTAETSSASALQRHVKLPPIKLKPFDGSQKEWREFRSIYESLIHNDNALSTTAKFHYLKSVLSGPALSIIKELPFSDENYLIAWNALVRRYTNNRLIGAELLSKMLKFPAIKKETSKDLTNFVATFSECHAALQGLPIADLADFIILQQALQCLPYGLQRTFERSMEDTEIPKTEDLMKFVRHQIRIVELYRPDDYKEKDSYGEKKADKSAANQKKSFVAGVSPKESKKPFCPKCEKAHFLYRCPRFLAESSDRRFSFVKQKRLCYNCLSNLHLLPNCEVQVKCRTCKERHHSLLHLNQTSPSPSNKDSEHKNLKDKSETDSTGGHNKLVSTTATSLTTSTSEMVLLGTAVVHIRGKNNKFFKVRSVIDPGSMTSLITQECSKRLGLVPTQTDSTLTGVGEKPMLEVEGATTCVIKPIFSPSPALSTTALIIPRITSNLPIAPVPKYLREKFKDLTLADPNYFLPKECEFLIAADLFPKLYTGGRIEFGDSEPTALESIFGWVITGKYQCHTVSPRTTLLTNLHDQTDQLLRNFWEVEEIKVKIPENPEDEFCENLYREKHHRDPSGRYVVPILLKPDHAKFGASYDLALSRFLSVERRLDKNPELKQSYSEFMTEYENLGHMAPVPASQQGKAEYYIPHHCVIKPSSTSTKVRVVFDAGMKTTSGVSLNDIQFAGKKLLPDIIDILSRFRLHKIVFCTDVCKMFRQILILPEHRKYQHILWRSDKNQPIQEFELNTVTYGLTSSPFLCNRTVTCQVPEDYEEIYPEAVDTFRKQTFVDDILDGDDDVPKAVKKKDDLLEVAKAVGFTLLKWASNSPEFLATLPPECIETTFDITDESDLLKLLGMQWQATQDFFSFKFTVLDPAYTKRGILSTFARIFDPLGFLAPLTSKIKILFQRLWIIGLDWDTSLPSTLKLEWSQIFESLPLLSKLRIPRLVVIPNYTRADLIGFSDASSLAYGTVIYLRTENLENREVKVSLVLAKSKVAPVKTISIPRLELCGAVLMSKALEKAHKMYRDQIEIQSNVTLTDSEVVLSWLKTLPCTLKTFEANRVTYILERTEPQMWQHVSTDQNPADMISRGCHVSDLIDNIFWYQGPTWLMRPMDEWPIKILTTTHQNAKEGLKNNQEFTCLSTLRLQYDFLMNNYSSWTKLNRITAWILRFSVNSRQIDPENRKSGELSVLELREAEFALVRITQKLFFEDELRKLSKGLVLSRYLQKLNPYLDEKNILRVRGRLTNADLPEEQKHPILLPKKAKLTELLIDSYHQDYLHVGPRTLQSLLARRYWIISARQIIRSRLAKCVTCFRANPRPLNPLMGDLPIARVAQGRAFISVGTDMGGPFWTKDTSLRKARFVKSYICLFICLATKAVHLELVSEMTTPAFLAALDRFTGRRGLPRDIYSDRGSNYIGARNYLNDISRFYRKPENQKEIEAYCSKQGISWHFLPAQAPNFGGIWESGIKSTKHHLKRVIGDQRLTFEAFSTVLSRVEAILNSRPLCALSDDPTEIDVLTPGHFLIGAPLLARAERDLSEVSLNRLSRWELLTRLSQSFWKRWQRDYLHTLQQRAKWNVPTRNLAVGDIVIILDPNCPPTHWALARVLELCPGRDNVVRVVKVRTSTGEYTRPVNKLCPLPAATMAEEENEETAAG